MKYKLLALDIDGTVVKEHANTPTAKVVEAIRKANEKVHVAMVSARAWKDQKIIIDLLKLKDFYHVVENGTKVINPLGKIEYHKHIPSREVQEIIEKTENLFDSVGFCIEGQWLSEYSGSSSKKISTISLISYRRTRANKIPHILQKHSNYSITVGAHWENPEWAVTLISHKDASKGAGLRYIQETLGILPEETIAVGDGASDVPTMQYAGVKVAMGNAEPELKRIATYIAPPVSENGLVNVINKFILSVSTQETSFLPAVKKLYLQIHRYT